MFSVINSLVPCRKIITNIVVYNDRLILLLDVPLANRVAPKLSFMASLAAADARYSHHHGKEKI